MSDQKGGDQDKGGSGGASKGTAAWPLWKKLAFSLAALCVVAGVGLRVYGLLTADRARVRVGDPTSPLIGTSGSSAGAAHLLQTGLAAGGSSGASGPGSSASEGRLSDQAGPILTQSGLAFFAAFCIGVALRFAARAAIVAIGFLLLGAIGLSLAGVIPPIDWTSLESPFRTMLGYLQVAVGKIEGALSHALPSGTMAGIGLASGLKKGA